MTETGFFSPDYHYARQQFQQRVRKRQGELFQLPINEKEGLYVDIAWWKGSRARLILHTSGVHGVEAFPGSAVQCAFLHHWRPEQLRGNSLMLIHAVNPYGMQHLRRWNADNVDLNRNFLGTYAPLPANPRYSRIQPALNPRTEIEQRTFILSALRVLSRYRFSQLQQTIAQGQYTDPTGLFYGGQQAAPETRQVLHFLKEHLSHYADIRGLDFHTGLGRYGQSSLYLEPDYTPQAHRQAEELMDVPVTYVKANRRLTYRAQGNFTAALRREFPDQQVLMLTQEIGTIGPLRILRALRRENYYFHHDPAHRTPAARRLKAAFCPADDRWKVEALRQGVAALFRIIHASRW